jgi:hypothetical protein
MIFRPQLSYAFRIDGSKEMSLSSARILIADLSPSEEE